MRSGPFLVAVSLALGVPAAAQSPAVRSPLTLDDAWAAADQRSPRIAEARTGISVAESSVTLATARPNPVFAVSSEGYPLFGADRPGFVNNQELGVRADLDIDPPGRRRVRTRVAAIGVESARAVLADERRRLKLDVAQAYLGVALALADDAVARAALDDVDRMLAVNTIRFALGELPGIDLRRLRTERQRFADEVFASELALRNARAVLLSLMGASPLDQVFETAQTLDGPMPGGEGPLTGGSASRPDLQSARLDIDQARAALTLEHANRTPGVTLGTGWRRDFGADGLIVSFSIPLPIFNRNQAGLARARADIAQAGARASAVEAVVSLETQLASNALDVARRRVASVERDYLTNATEARDIVLASYRAGAATLLDYLDAERMWREALRARNRARFDSLLAVHRLHAARGTEASGQESR